MRLAWEKIVNPPASMLGTSQTSEILSFFFDSVLKGSRGKARISVDDQKKFVLQGIEIWDYLNDKVNLSIYQFLSIHSFTGFFLPTSTTLLTGFIHLQILFIETYATYLMHRLLEVGTGGRFVSDHTVEDLVVRKLKSRHSATYTKKIETMFSDLTSASAVVLRTEFIAWHATQGRAAVKMNARLVSRTAWPSLPGSAPEDDFTLPDDLQAAQQSFTTFYAEKNEDRNVKFHKPLCKVTLQLTLKKCSAKLTMDTVQCAVLALFRVERLELTYGQIQTALAIDPELLTRVLQILTKKMQHCNGPLLLKAPKSKAVLPTDRFKFNSKKFMSKAMKLSFPSSYDADTAQASSRAFEMRKQYLEASIVRSLKASKTMDYATLVEMVKSQITLFPVQARDVKLAIAGLIERKYVERHPTLEKTFKYVCTRALALNLRDLMLVLTGSRLFTPPPSLSLSSPSLFRLPPPLYSYKG